MHKTHIRGMKWTIGADSPTQTDDFWLAELGFGPKEHSTGYRCLHTFHVHLDVFQTAAIVIDYKRIGLMHGSWATQGHLGPGHAPTDADRNRTAGNGHFVEWHVDRVLARLRGHKRNRKSAKEKRYEMLNVATTIFKGSLTNCGKVQDTPYTVCL